MVTIQAIVFAAFIVLDLFQVQAASAPTKVIIGHPTINSRITALWIAQEQGFFTKHNTEAELIFVRSTPILISSLASGYISFAYGGGGAMLGTAVAGENFKTIASFTPSITNDLVARPGINSPKDLYRKTVGVQSIGGTNWMSIMLWLEHLGLDAHRDGIRIQVIGDQMVRTQALEAGRVDAVAIDSIFSQRLKQKGFVILGDSHREKVPFVGGDLVVTKASIQERYAALENVLKALIEGLAFVVTPRNKRAVLETMAKRLKLSGPVGAEEGYQDLLSRMERKPYPSVEGLRNVQRLMKTLNPRVAEVKAETLIDSSFIRKLDEGGFIDRLYGSYSEK